MDNDDVRSISENDQLKEDAYQRYIEWLVGRQEELLDACEVLEVGPQLVGSLPSETVDFIFDMASVCLRDFAERHLSEADE